MTQVFLKGELSDTLSGLTDRSELLNENGELLGVFMPAKLNKLPMFGDITEEEIERRCKTKGGKTLSQIWAELGVSS